MEYSNCMVPLHYRDTGVCLKKEKEARVLPLLLAYAESDCNCCDDYMARLKGSTPELF
jgi:hypothetical protein